MSLIARSGHLPQYHNGKGLWGFGMDSFQYHDIAVIGAQKIAAGEYSFFLKLDNENTPHTKLITTAYYLFGADPFSFEPVNALTWALSVFMVYLTAKTLFGEGSKAPWLAGLLYGLFPSNLALSTQLMKDPIFNLACLLIVYGCARLITGKGKAAPSALSFIGLALAVVTRVQAAPFLLAAILISTMICAFKKREVLIYSASASILSIGLVMFSMKAAEPEDKPRVKFATAQEYYSYFDKKQERLNKENAEIEHVKKALPLITGAPDKEDLGRKIDKWFEPGVAPWKTFEERKRVLLDLAEVHGQNLPGFLEQWNRPWEESRLLPSSLDHALRIANSARDNFVSYYVKTSGSLMDGDVIFRSAGEMMAYIPRSVEIGFFAPFPTMWFDKGQTGGKMARAVGAFEILIWYGLYAAFAWFLLKSRQPVEIKLWLALFCLITIIPLGVLTPNIGTLHRLRHVYLAPVLIGGLEGLRLIFASRRKSA
ncbi:MAG: glycosyltransferase family 39 protein [Nitrospinae bacterium]|nr:glycosyltransferase family 39 protein [Nitrospinota bacterium]